MLKYNLLLLILPNQVANQIHNTGPNKVLRTVPSYLPNQLSHCHPTKQVNYSLCITLGSYLMFVSLFVMTISILLSYVFTEHFSLGVQITAHISTIITAAIAKIAYVIRCIGAHGLGHKAF